MMNPSPMENSLEATMAVAGGLLEIGPGFSLFAAHDERLIPARIAGPIVRIEFIFMDD